MAMYMAYVRPLSDRWEADSWAFYVKMIPLSDFIWHGKTGPWESSRMSRVVSKWTHHYMGWRITLQYWRHIAIAISKKLARDRGVKRLILKKMMLTTQNSMRFQMT